MFKMLRGMTTGWILTTTKMSGEMLGKDSRREDASKFQIAQETRENSLSPAKSSLSSTLEKKDSS